MSSLAANSSLGLVNEMLDQDNLVSSTGLIM